VNLDVGLWGRLGEQWPRCRVGIDAGAGDALSARSQDAILDKLEDLAFGHGKDALDDIDGEPFDGLAVANETDTDVIPSGLKRAR
jgi:hypothetical protein